MPLDTKVTGESRHNWFFANDPQRHVSRAMVEAGAVNRFVLVNGEGRVIARGDAGKYTPRPDGWRFDLAHTAVIKGHLADAQPVLLDPRQQLPDIQPIAKMALVGNIGKAFKGAAKAGPAGIAFGQGTMQRIQDQVATDVAQLAKLDQPAVSRWHAFQRLQVVSSELAGSPAAVEAAKAVRGVSKDEELERERQAIAGWLRLNEHLDDMPQDDQDAINAIRTKGLQQIQEHFPATQAAGWSARGIIQG